MKVEKRITIIADVLVDEDFDTMTFLLIAQNISNQTDMDCPLVLTAESDEFEVLDYIYQDEMEIKKEYFEN